MSATTMKEQSQEPKAADAEKTAVEQSETLTVVKQVPAEGTFTIPVGEITTDRYPNGRTSVTEDHIEKMRRSLKDAQLHNLVGWWTEEGGIRKFGVYAGFCRTECFRRNALEKLVKEYNEERQLKPGDAGYIPLGGKGFGSHAEREKIKEAGPEWAAKYNDALNSVMVRVEAIKPEDDIDAALRNFGENRFREDITLLDENNAIINFLELGKSGRQVAAAIGISDGAVSQHKLLHDLPQYLEDTYCDQVVDGKPAPKLAAYMKHYGLPESDAREKQARVVGAIQEYNRRFALPKKDDCSIKFSHCREYAGRVMHKKEPLSFVQAAELLIRLTAVDNLGRPTEVSTMDYSVWMTILKDAATASKKLDTVAAPAAAPMVTVDELAKQQAAEGGATATPAPAATAPAATEVSTGNVPATAPTTAAPANLTTTAAPAVAAPATGPTQAEKDALAEAELAQANEAEGGTGVPADILEALADDDGDLDIEGMIAGPSEAVLAAGDQVGDEPKVEDGKSRVRQVEAPVDAKYKMLSAAQIEAQAVQLLRGAASDGMSFMDQGSCMVAANALLDALGLSVEANAVQAAFITFDDAFAKYHEALVEAVKVSNPARYDAVMAMRPTYVVPDFAK